MTSYPHPAYGDGTTIQAVDIAHERFIEFLTSNQYIDKAINNLFRKMNARKQYSSDLYKTTILSTRLFNDISEHTLITKAQVWSNLEDEIKRHMPTDKRGLVSVRTFVTSGDARLEILYTQLDA